MLVQNRIYTQNIQPYTLQVDHHFNGNLVSFKGIQNPVNKHLRKVPPELIQKLNLYELKLEDVLAKIIDSIIKKDQPSSKDKIAFQEVFKKVFPIIHKDEHKLGEGYHSAVYEINKKYALKCRKDATISDIGSIKSTLKVPFNRFSSLITYYGNELMTFGEHGDFSIIYNLGRHTPAGVPENIPPENIFMYYISEYLPRFAKVPQNSFDAIASDCEKLNSFKSGSYYYTFDFYNPSNILLKDDILFFVDEIDSGHTSNSLTQLLEMLLLKANPDIPINNGYAEATNDARTIFKKILLAAARTKLEISPNKYIDSCQYERLYTHNVWKDILSNLKSKKSDGFVLQRLKMKYLIPDTETRVAETNKLIEVIFPEK